MSAGPSEMDAFLAAIDRSPANRDAYLDSLGDPTLAARVRALIAAHDDLGDDEPVRISNPHLALPARPETLVGKIVDGFEITGILGRGGMGIVFDARQLAPERRVALKTIAQVVADETDLLRFEREGKFLARLAHPGIAHVYGVGRAEALGGLPYLAMEFIDGEPIDRWVASRALSIDDRLRLLAETAETTAHVHVRGVIHRDLKPANILVDREGRTKILDFGIARLDDRDGGGRSQETRTGQILGTLPYMSPEQVGGDPSAVDGRTDVYALGVIAYELLAGRLPLDLSAMALPSAVRKIVEVEPPSPAAFDARLRGDVETVVKKAIAKSPNDRYATAAEFAADIRRILSHEPIVARPPSRIYRLRKLVRRNRVAFTGLAAVICSLTFGLGWALIERDRAVAAGKAADVAREKAVTSEAETAVAKVAAEKSAERERLRAQSTKRLNQLLAEMIGRSTPHENGGRAIEVAEMVDELAQKIDDTFTNDPYVRAWVHLYLSRARRQSGRYDDARRHLASAKSAFDQSPLTDAADRIEVKCYEALPGFSDKSPNDTIEELRALLDSTKSIDDDGRAEALVAMSLAVLLARENQDAETAVGLAKDALRITERRFGRSSPEYATDVHSLGFVLSKTSRSDECLAAYEEAAAIRRAKDPESLALAATLENIGHKLQEIRRIDDAVPYYKESLDIKRKVFGSNRHVEFGYGLDNFGTLLRDLGQVKESLPYFEEAAEIFRTKLGEESEDLGIALNEHATALRHLSETEKAQALSDRAVAILRKTKKSTSTALAAALELNGTLALDRGDGAKGLELGREALAIREAAHGKDDHRLGRSIVVYATGLLFLERWQEAEDLGRRSLTLRKAHWGANSWQTYEDAHVVYFALARQKKFEEAEELAEDTLEIMRKELGRDHRRSKVALLNFSGILRLQGKIDEAKALEAELKRP